MQPQPTATSHASTHLREFQQKQRRKNAVTVHCRVHQRRALTEQAYNKQRSCVHRQYRGGEPIEGNSIKDMAPVFVPCVVWTVSSCVVCMVRAKRDTRYPWMDSALPRSLPRGRPPLHLIVLEDI